MTVSHKPVCAHWLILRLSEAIWALTRLPYSPLQEATACGVKVTEARRVLKLMQALESAQQPSSGSDTSSAYRTLKTRLEAAEQGGVCPSFMQPAKAQLRRLLMADVKKAIETALKTRPGRRAALKTGVVRDALDHAESLLETGLGDEAEPFLLSTQNWRALHVKSGVNGQLAGGHAGDRGESGGAKPVSGDVMAIPDAAAVKRMLGEAYRSAIYPAPGLSSVEKLPKSLYYMFEACDRSGFLGMLHLNVL